MGQMHIFAYLSIFKHICAYFYAYLCIFMHMHIVTYFAYQDIYLAYYAYFRNVYLCIFSFAYLCIFFCIYMNMDICIQMYICGLHIFYIQHIKHMFCIFHLCILCIFSAYLVLHILAYFEMLISASFVCLHMYHLHFIHTNILSNLGSIHLGFACYSISQQALAVSTKACTLFYGITLSLGSIQ